MWWWYHLFMIFGGFGILLDELLFFIFITLSLMPVDMLISCVCDFVCLCVCTCVSSFSRYRGNLGGLKCKIKSRDVTTPLILGVTLISLKCIGRGTNAE